MKKAKLGDYLLWKGELANIVSRCDLPTIGIKILNPRRCPHCQGELEHTIIDVVESAPQFQENAKAIPTIDE